MGQALGPQTPNIASVEQQGQKNDGVTWWCRFLARAICVIAGISAAITGLFRLFTFTPLCLVAGILLMLLGFAAILLEAPCCCQFLDFIQPVSRFSERRSYWQKAAMYTLPAFLPPMLCFSLTTMCGSALLIAAGVVHGLIAVGRKADRETMMTRAKNDEMEMKETLITEQDTVGPRP